MKTGWLLYEESDLAKNRDFAAYVEKQAVKLGLGMATVLTAQLTLGVREGGQLLLQKDGRDQLPDFVLSRQRDALISAQFERLGIPVFNSSLVCSLCNDKRATHQFLAGLPMLRTRFVSHRRAVAPAEGAYPVVVKPAQGHGGEHVALVNNEYEWRDAVDEILPHDIVEQQVASEAGSDLRVYVLFGKIIAGVMRTASRGIVSNYKLGGNVAAHTLTEEERALAESVIGRFDAAGAPLSFAGVDFLYHQGHPVLSEVEDVVGSRMLYKVSKTDIISDFLEGVRTRI
ncbi:MAG TPA: ATP-grasp domain-containing protein [Candidatus Limiplasma sp.]|nr:ATP-grasp domain-containing protein [Candidatus Limiplasma sp.]HPS80572.1 ATP-grasp domain-containing protein [Candidatus Limiplasma sp.]